MATVAMKLFIAYLQQAEECERQARIAKKKSKRQGFLDAAAQWRRLAAEAECCESIALLPIQFGGGMRLQRGLTKSGQDMFNALSTASRTMAKRRVIKPKAMRKRRARSPTATVPRGGRCDG
jgi:hypothetical protein